MKTSDLIIMVKISQFDTVTIFQMGRELFGKVLYPVHAFLVEDLLIDTGSISAQKHIMPIWKQYPIAQIINTHEHEDHIGNNRILQEKYGCAAFAHTNALDIIRDPTSLHYYLYERLSWGIPKSSQVNAISTSFSLKKHHFEVIHTPGHAPGHICLYEPKKKWLFSGDLFLSTHMIYLRQHEEFQTQIRSLERINQLDIDEIFCGFRGHVSEGNRKIQKKIESMKELQAHVLEYKHAGMSPKSIRKKLLHREGMFNFLTNKDYSKQNLINTILQENSE